MYTSIQVCVHLPGRERRGGERNRNREGEKLRDTESVMKEKEREREIENLPQTYFPNFPLKIIPFQLKGVHTSSEL